MFERLSPYLWVAPAVLLYGTFTIVPLVAGIYLAFLRWDGIEPAEFIGLDNFRRMMRDPKLLGALAKNLQYAIGTVTGKIVISLVLALLLNGAMWGRAFYRTALFMPVVMSFVVVGILWTRIFNYDFGLLNTMLTAVGLEASTRDWIGNTSTALWSLIGVDIWKWYGFHMVIFLAGLQTIPAELYEAARIDGASSFQRLRTITLPLLRPVMLVNVFISMVGALNVFDIPFIMTQGGPSDSTNVIALHMYTQAFSFYRFGYGAALSYVLFALVSVVAVILIAVMSRNRTEY
ncbi:MAG: sugar ABC transporter permease [Chloroflexota bacterium]|nr:sugar ABC transporter permease [Chloroflexota bacterium]